MNGDYSRFSFDPKRNYHGVLLQQGRPLLDQDWNEQSEIVARHLRAARLDMFGRVFVTTPDAFKIESDGRGGLLIGRGRIYVDGLLAENHGAGRLIWDAALDEQYGEAPVSYAQQPYLPDAPKLPRSGGPYVVYLDVWQREVTAIEDPDLADSALGGADTVTRVQTVWQVKLHRVSSAGAMAPLARDQKFKPSTVRLSTMPAAGGYTGIENALYRVEIHDGGAAGAATFKWSRDNASTAARVTRLIDLSRLVIKGIGADAMTRFSTGDWIEITDDPRELGGLPGELRRIKATDVASSTLTLDAPLSPGLFPTDPNGVPDAKRHMRIWRWDSAGVTPVSGQPVELEYGIAVRFDFDRADGCCRTGDHWLIPARSNDASIAPLDCAAPRGIHHHFVKLALFTPPRRLRDLRPRSARRI